MLIFRTLDAATYNCPWLNTGFGSIRHIFLKVCTWDLIVSQNVSLRGNCLRYYLNGILLSYGIKGSRGLKNVKLLSESMAFASIIFRCNLIAINLVPLHCPWDGAKFLNNIMIHSIFKFNLCWGVLVGVGEFKNSSGLMISWSW